MTAPSPEIVLAVGQHWHGSDGESREIMARTDGRVWFMTSADRGRIEPFADFHAWIRNANSKEEPVAETYEDLGSVIGKHRDCERPPSECRITCFSGAMTLIAWQPTYDGNGAHVGRGNPNVPTQTMCCSTCGAEWHTRTQFGETTVDWGDRK